MKNQGNEAQRARVAARKKRDLEAAKKKEEAEAREAAYRAALSKPPPSPRALVETFLKREPDWARHSRVSELLLHVAEVAPRLIDDGYLGAFRNACEVDWVRPLDTWVPRGKGKETLFRSLMEHLFARFPMPPFLWTAFDGRERNDAFILFAAQVAAGGSAYKAVQEGLLPVPLTRKMCHELMTVTGVMSFLEAIRRVQVRSCGGDAHFLRAWMGTRAGERLHPRVDEDFWQTVLAWFCANPMLPSAEVGPLVDYIIFRRNGDTGFSMKGRSPLALLGGMREWHGDLAKARAGTGKIFRPSGFVPLDVDRSRRDATGNHAPEIWHIKEILDSKTLADEGKVMHHCVFSYADRISSGDTSIWVMTLEDETGHWRRLTIEVRNGTRRVVQARGRFNKMPEAKDLAQLNIWAERNRLEVVAGRW